MKLALLAILLISVLPPPYLNEVAPNHGLVVISPDRITLNNLHQVRNPPLKAIAYVESLDEIEGRSYFAFKFGGGYLAGVVLDGKARNNLNVLFYDRPLSFHSVQQTFVKRYVYARSLANLTGEGVRIGVVDTGVDFSHPDLIDALAKESGLPLMLDADGQGIAVTNVVVKANVVNGKIENLTSTSCPYVFVREDGVYVDFGEGYEVRVYNPLFPYYGDLFFNVTVDGTWKIGNSTSEFILSKSGEYRFGVLAEIQPIYYKGEETTALFLFPVLTVDDRREGFYETVYVDLSTVYKEYINFLKDEEVEKPDYDFYDENPHRLGDGSEVIARDFDGDGYPDITAGVLGAYVLDVWGAVKKRLKRTDLGPSYGVPLDPIDYNGTYFTVMYDLYGHGTAVAGLIASRGVVAYNVTKEEGLQITGVAPGSKIVAVKALWVSDVLYAWFWLAGMDYNGSWSYRGSTRADIVVNSFGISDWPYLEGLPGRDILSMLTDLMSVPGSLDKEYPGMLMVVSAGNGGPGRGTITPPGSSMFALTVGASTCMDWTLVKPEVIWSKGPQARFGSTSYCYDDVAPWSARGPTLSGTPKPEFVAPGMYGFSLAPVTLRAHGSQAYSLFGGTSMSAPIVAGCAALVLQGLEERGIQVDPATLKTYLVASTDSLGFSPSEQGSGLINFTKAVLGATKGWNLAAYSLIDPETYKILHEYTFERLNITLNIGSLPPVKVTYLQFPFMPPGRSFEKDLFVEGSSSFNAEAIKVKRYEIGTYRNVSVINAYDPILGESGGWRPLYIPLDEIVNVSDFDRIRITLAYPRSYFYNLNKSYVYFDALNRLSLYLYEWEDANKDGKIWYNETKLISFAAGWTNVQSLDLKRRNVELLIGVYETPKMADYWTGELHGNVTEIPFEIKVEGLKFVEDENVELKIDGNRIKVKVTAPEEPGIYEGFVRIYTDKDEVWIPYSYQTMITIDGFDKVKVLELRDLNIPPDASWRYESGDWYPIRILTRKNLNALSLNVTWKGEWNGISAFVFDGYGRLLTSNVFSGGLMEVFGWPSTDWMGPAGLGSGGFYPPEPSTIKISARTNFLYTLVLHLTSNSVEEEVKPKVIITASFVRNETTPPKVTFKDKNWTVISGVHMFNWTVTSKAPYKCYYRIDLGDWIEARTNRVRVNATGGADGVHLLSVMVVDASGQTAESTLPFIVDNTPPIIEIEGLKDGDLISKRLKFNVTVDEPNLALLSVKILNKWYNVTEPKLTIDLDISELSGALPVKILAVDEVNHTSEKLYTFYVDNEPPVIKLISPENGQQIKSETKIVYEVYDSNLANVTVKIDGKIVKEMFINPKNLVDGAHTLRIEAEDRVGQKSSKEIVFYTSYYSAFYQKKIEEVRNLHLAIGAVIGALLTGLIAFIKKLKRK